MHTILIHAINGIGMGHINRLVVLAKGLQFSPEVQRIVFVTNSQNMDFIRKHGFEVEYISVGVEDTLEHLSFQDFETQGYLQLEKYIKKYSATIIIHDTFFISSVVKQIRYVSHFLILRDSELEYLQNIAQILPFFRSVYIPHCKEELDMQKQDFYKNFSNIFYIGYVIDQEQFLLEYKEKVIVISPGYGGDYENTKNFFQHVINIISEKILKEYKIIVFLGKHYELLQREIKFPGNFLIKKFDNNFKDFLKKAEIFIGRGGYNSLLESIYYQCKTLLFPVERFAENQERRIAFFKERGYTKIYKGDFNNSDLYKLEQIAGDQLKKEYCECFSGKENFLQLFFKEIQKPNILIFKHIFLPKSENFIYEEIKSLKIVNPLIFSLKQENMEKFLLKCQHFYFGKFEELLSKEYPFVRNSKLYLDFIKLVIFILKKNNVKVIYTEFLFDAYFLRQIKKILPNIKIISAARGYDIYVFLNQISHLQDFFMNLEKILVRDDSMKNFLLNSGVSLGKIEKVRSVVDIRKYHYIEKEFNKYRILIGGRFVEKKGIIQLLDVIKGLEKNTNIISIDLVGDGELKDRIFQKISDLGLIHRINISGFLPHNELIKKMQECNCFINYSQVASNGDSEGANNMIIENMLSGNIVFSTVVGGIGEELIHGKTGFALTGDMAQDIYTIEQAMKYKDQVFQITKNALNHVKQHFSSYNSVEKLEKIFKNAHI